MPQSARRRRRIGTGGPWGTGLLLLSIASISIGISYVTRPKRDVPDPLLYLSIPTAVWASLWIVAGVFGAWKALRPPQRHFYIAPFAFLAFSWSAAYAIYWLIGGIHGHWDSSWGGAAVWAMFGALLICWGGKCINPPQS